MFLYDEIIKHFSNKEETDVRFYYLSLIKENTDEYSIHGLWPQYNKH